MFTQADEEHQSGKHQQENPQTLNILLMDFQDTMDDRNFPSFYPKDDYFSHSDWIFNSVGEEQEISSVESRLHTPTEKRGEEQLNKI